MYTVALGSLIGAIIGSILLGTVFAGINYSVVSYAIWGAIIGAGVCAAVGLLVAIYLISYLVPMKNVVSKPIKLVAMRSSKGTSGTFIWGSGAMSNSNIYNFMQLVEDGSMVPGRLPANHLVHLIEDANLKNTGFWSTTTLEADETSPFYRWALVDSETVREEFRVPVGTVMQQFHIE